MRKVVFIQGGGIGFDQEQSVRRIISAVGIEIDWQVYPAGWAAASQGLPILPEEMLRAVRETGVALKTKLLPDPAGASAPRRTPTLLPAKLWGCMHRFGPFIISPVCRADSVM